MEGNITHTTITCYGYGTLRLKKVPTKQGLYLFYTTYLFCTIFLINFVLPSGNLLHMPPNFYFAAPSSQLTFATSFCNSCLRPPFATHCFATNPSCESTTDRQTVSTPHHHLPSVPTLTLTNFFKELSLLPGTLL